MQKAAQAYFQTKVSTTDQGQLLILLYDGALKYLQQARDRMLAKDYAGKGILISKVIDIVNELSASLNMERGGDLAVNLNNLYILCTARLLQANLKMNLETLDSVYHILSGLRGAYAQILETPEAREASAQISERLQPAVAVKARIQAPQPQTATASMAHAKAVYGRAVPAGPQGAAPQPSPEPQRAVVHQFSQSQSLQAPTPPPSGQAKLINFSEARQRAAASGE
ncbi:MAG: flagellar export chaperone FliS [Desulfovibrio sp.]|jgi:flagellar protein FliS|nr:flagellar export chaperone FliS [Desulfovibrio sp.]